jgi:glycerol uptake facilitator-like aquaporin
MADLARRLVAEGLGTAVLVATVVGSGIMAERLTSDGAIALLGNTLPTGAILVVLVTIFAPISGAHFNPAVSLVMAIRRLLVPAEAAAYVLAQIAGGLLGTVAAHAMFGIAPFQVSAHVRNGAGQWLSECIATLGLILVITCGSRFRKEAVPWLVGLYIVAAYWFTASTSFANPAVTIARALTDSYSGIRPLDVPIFIAAQIAGALLGLALAAWLLRGPGRTQESKPTQRDAQSP